MTLLAVALALGACNLDTPTQPTPGLTGTNPNTDTTFNGTIQLAVSSTSIDADDASTVTITATVRDAQGRPVQNLTPVVFSTNLGHFGGGFTAVTVTTFNGQASAVLSSMNRTAGTATISATVGDKTVQTQIVFELVPIEGTLSLSFTGTTTTLTGKVTPSVPFRTPLLAAAEDDSGNALAGVQIRFRIIEDDSTGSGRGGARLEGEGSSFTNASGEATNQLVVFGAGRVVLEADLLDPNTGEVVVTSNQIILVTTEDVAATTTTITLGIDGADSTTAEETAPFTASLEATVKTGGETLAGATVRFVIEADSTTGASLTNTGTTTTNADGVAVNGLTVPSVGSVTVFAEVLDSAGNVIARSNSVLATGTS